MSKYKPMVLLASAWLGASRCCADGYGGIRLGCLGYGNRIIKYVMARSCPARRCWPWWAKVWHCSVRKSKQSSKGDPNGNRLLFN